MIDPVRSLLNDVLRQLAAPYDPNRKDNPIGQGWWIQAEFGTGKSHLLAFIGALAIGDDKAWAIVMVLETKNKKGKRESIYQFYEDGLAKKSSGKKKGIFVTVKTLVGQGGGTIGVPDTGRKLTEYILDAVQDQYLAENGKPISVYPVEVLADRFESELEMYRKPLAKFLKDPTFFDEEEQEDIEQFLDDLRNSKNPMRDLLDIASRDQPLPPINTAGTDHDFAVFISNRPCGDKVTDLAKRTGDCRTLFWTPAPLAPQERDRLLDFAAYRELVKDYQGKDTEEAKDVVQWVANRLKDEIGSIAKIVGDSYDRGQISATEHNDLKFTCQGELVAILSPLVGQVLDGVYLSKKIEFDAPAPFNDAEAIKVINGVVKTGDIPKGTKPNQYTSAADNYGYALGVMKKDGTKRLNTQGNEFVEDLEQWIDTHCGSSSQEITVETICKNFTGVGGPNEKNYGLSRRMIDIYLLCLVREGKLRIILSGKGAATAETIDYTNIGDLTFNAALLNSMAKVQRLKAPEGWPVLAPYAAILLDDESLKQIQKDADITAALDRLRRWRDASKPEMDAGIERLNDLMSEIQQANPVADTLASWNAFLSAKIDDTDVISYLLNALDTAFGYTCYAQQQSTTTELDDLATRKKTWERADAFCRHEQRIRAAYRYAQLVVEKSGPVGQLKDKLRTLRKKLDNIADLMESEAKLQSQLLDLLDTIQSTYKTRYLQAFDEVTGKCEQVRTEIDRLPDCDQFKAIAELVKIEALGSVNVAALTEKINKYKDCLFESALDRNGVDAGLKHRPQPEGCTLHIDQADSLVAAEEQALEQARAEVHAALLNIASLLLQPALKALLEQGKDEPFIVDVLAASSDETLAETLAQCIPADPAHAKLLAKYLKKIVVKVVHLQDFQPSKTKVEKADIETVVGEFRRFLETALDDRDGKQSIIGELR